MSNDKWRFEAQPGFFKDFAAEQVTPDTPAAVTEPSLALLHRSYPTDKDSSDKDWPRFEAYVRSLNAEAGPNVRYKVIYLTRHGIGFHNLKQREVGDEEWDNYWSKLDGDETTTWFDSFLAPQGIVGVDHLSTLWTTFVDVDGVPLPETLYTSPAARCLQTSKHVFGPVFAAHGKPYHPIVKELLRERLTMHTCDKRRPRSWIAENWPEYIVEDGFEEEDRLGNRDTPETHDEHRGRKQRALEDLFETDENQFIAWVCHSAAIRAILSAVNTKTFRVTEGSSYALLVKGEKLL